MKFERSRRPNKHGDIGVNQGGDESCFFFETRGAEFVIKLGDHLEMRRRVVGGRFGSLDRMPSVSVNCLKAAGVEVGQTNLKL